MTEITVLIVDDPKLIRDSWQHIIELKEPFKVVGSTGNTDEALELAKTLKPRIILMDINMQPLNGMELMREIFKFSPSQFVIGVSTHSQPVIAKKFLKIGGRAYVTKNSTTEELLHALIEVSNGRRYISMDIRQNFLTQDDTDTREKVLSSREMQIIAGIRKGLTSAEIAETLGMSKRTAETHRYNIFKKLQVKNSISLVKAISEMGF